MWSEHKTTPPPPLPVQKNAFSATDFIVHLVLSIAKNIVLAGVKVRIGAYCWLHFCIVSEVHVCVTICQYGFSEI